MKAGTQEPVASLPLFVAVKQGRAQADLALANTRKLERSWPERAFTMLVAYINLKRGEGAWSGERAVEFVLRQPGIEKPETTRAFGALFFKAARQGRIKRSAELFQRAHGHGTKSPGWETIDKTKPTGETV